MATPDYLQQVIVSGRNHAGSGRRTSAAETGLFRRPSITSTVWASLDMLTVVVAAMMALRFRVATPPDLSRLNVLPHLIESSPNLLPFYIGWFGICVVFFTRSYGLYGSIQHRSGLHEQRIDWAQFAHASLPARSLSGRSHWGVFRDSPHDWPNI